VVPRIGLSGDGHGLASPQRPAFDRAYRSGRDRDPLGVLLAFVFWVVVLHRLGIPSKPMFDEIHYLPAARR
jgi:hypothetical protein